MHRRATARAVARMYKGRAIQGPVVDGTGKRVKLVIDLVRYLLAVAIVIVAPLGLLYWLVIHLAARWWRVWGPIRTYVAVLPMLAALGVLLFEARDYLLGENLGTNWSLIGIALVLSCPSIWLEFQCWKQLT